MFSPIFSTNFSQLEQLKRKTNFLLVLNRVFFRRFGPMKSLLSFQMLKLRKIRGKQDWWFDVTIKIVVNNSIIFLFEKTRILSSSSSIFRNDFLFAFEKCANTLCIVHLYLQTKFESKFDYCAIISESYFFIWWWPIS